MHTYSTFIALGQDVPLVLKLDDLHRRLLKSMKHPVYSSTYYHALPFIVELRAKNKDKYKEQSTTNNEEEKSEIENCFDALYGLMLLRLQGKPVSEETKKAMGYISKFIALLAEYYKKDKTESIEL